MNEVIEHTTDIKLDPRLLYEALGNKIIELDSIAIAEQIKNASDAGAENIIVDFSNFKNDVVEIRDNGSGMTLDEIKENWLLVATSNKSNDLTQLGGKGIGRFSLFRLAK
ncbi:ATP-binding protein [Lysinibacillus sp. G01H]|uniref:ATP-binding protein n=1 Tax=Lysinibacillus sp. G01H TaxID=3026425 RepID=UPI00237E5A4F|nr:ATP-binding protein [Lysinibacillus sp. G01H]WDU77557.1 ATP-binding protein [Lysinibacillus sp. G01H]